MPRNSLQQQAGQQVPTKPEMPSSPRTTRTQRTPQRTPRSPARSPSASSSQKGKDKESYAPLNTYFKKSFGDGVYVGKVMKIRPLARGGKTRRVLYEDGDSEDLTPTEVERLLRLNGPVKRREEDKFENFVDPDDVESSDEEGEDGSSEEGEQDAGAFKASSPGIFNKAGKNSNGESGGFPPVKDTLVKLMTTVTPWHVLNNKGSMNGYFNFVPEDWRIGRWSVFALPAMVAMAAYLVSAKPTEAEFSEFFAAGALDSTYYGSMMMVIHCVLICNNILTLYFILRRASAAVFGTYTIISWSSTTLHLILTFAEGLPLFAKFKPMLIAARQLTRFISMVSAVVTFAVWNFALAPVMYFFFCKTDGAKTRFKSWNFSIQLTELHALNFPIAMAATMWMGRR